MYTGQNNIKIYEDIAIFSIIIDVKLLTQLITYVLHVPYLNYSRLDPYQHASVPESINMKNMLFPDVKIDLRRNIKRGFYTLY